MGDNKITQDDYSKIEAAANKVITEAAPF